MPTDTPEPRLLVSLGNEEDLLGALARGKTVVYGHYDMAGCNHVCVRIRVAPSGYDFESIYSDDRFSMFQLPYGNYPSWEDFRLAVQDDLIIWKLTYDK